MPYPPRPLALSQGDPAGIGLDVTLAAWLGRDTHSLPPFIFIGDSALLAARARMLGLDVPLRVCSVDEACAVFASALPVLEISAGVDVVAGEPHVATRNEGAVKETHGAIAMLIAGEAPRVEETAQQAVAADAEAALEMAGENAASRGGAQVVRRGGPARPRAPWRNTKRV